MVEKIGFIGLGEMGMGMAANLIKSGYQVLGFDLNETACEEAAKKGINICTSIKEVAENSENMVISIVRDYYQTKEVIFGENGIVSSDNKGLTVIVMSTFDPFDLGSLAEELDEKGYKLIDAPISGAKAKADDGTLTIMTAGKKNVVEPCRHCFEAMGKNIFYFGDKIGSAQIAKLSNNLMLFTNAIGCAEGLKFGESFDLPSEELLELYKVSTGNSWVVQNWDVVSKWWEDYEPNKTLDLGHKDIFSVLTVCFRTKQFLPSGGFVFSNLLNILEKRRG